MSTLSPPIPPSEEQARRREATPAQAPTAPASNGSPLAGAAYREDSFPALRLARIGRFIRRLGKVLVAVLFIAVLAAFFAPWQQSILGRGSVIAFDPFERPQPVVAPIKGLIAERGPGVQENAYVEKGDLLFRIKDQDPNFLDRLGEQVENARFELKIAEERLAAAERVREAIEFNIAVTSRELEEVKLARDEILKANDQYVMQAEGKIRVAEAKLADAEATLFAAEADFERKKPLFESGIRSELKFQEVEQKYRGATAKRDQAVREIEIAKQGLEGKRREREAKRSEWQAKIQKVGADLNKVQAEISKAEVDVKKNREEIAKKKNDLLNKQSKLSVQETQDVRALVDGYVMSLNVVPGVAVKSGQQLCRIVPKTENPAVQIWVAGNDQTFIHEGDHVRLQFEGWPAVQFAGWPSVAVGTFGGTVALVDATTDKPDGKFRVVIVPDENDPVDWPEYPYLRQGVQAKGWVLLETVPLGFEIWRRLNAFPPVIDMKKDTGPKPPKIKI
ncbi:MAG: HlyD family efflux transporter periplasmic adaptor subunit [Planctomycetota bacterium]